MSLQLIEASYRIFDCALNTRKRLIYSYIGGSAVGDFFLALEDWVSIFLRLCVWRCGYGVIGGARKVGDCASDSRNG